MPLAGRFRRLAENFVPHSSSGAVREFVERESGGPPDSARGPRALPGAPGGALHTYERRLHGPIQAAIASVALRRRSFKTST
jgi:hypothetical protein